LSGRKLRKGIRFIKNKNPVVVPVSLSFVRAPAHLGYSGSKGHKIVVVVVPSVPTLK